MQILKILLYGNNGERRDVDFRPGEVNVVTGGSKRGKSSLIDIVEYCLGSSECHVAAGHIRNTVAWYAVLFEFPDTEVFIARAAPMQGRKSNSACHMLVATTIDCPNNSDLESSTNVSSVHAYLTSKIGIPEQTTEVPADQTRASIKIGFRHSQYYLFQSQDEVAAKRLLFHRQTEQHIPQIIRDTLPYFVGAAEDHRLSELEKLRALKRDRARTLKRIKEIESIKGEGLQKGYELLAEASQVGLYDGELVLKDKKLISVLRTISEWVSTFSQEDESGEDVFHQLNRKYDEFSERKRIVRSKIRIADDYATSLGGFENEMKEQSLRLSSIGLYKNIASDSSCPICESVHDEVSSSEHAIRSSIDELRTKLDGVSRNRPRIDGYLEELHDEDRQLASDIRTTRVSIEAIRKNDIVLAKKFRSDDSRARIVGRVSLYLESIDWSNEGDIHESKLRALQPQIEELEERLDPLALKEKLNSQLSIIAEDMTKWARELGLEHSEHRIRIDANKLTVVAETPHGLTPLYNMGSGENWVGYHLVSYLAFAKWFIEQRRPVARFIFFDQPTQVYFPTEKVVSGKLDEIEDDEDRAAVRKMFKWIFKVVSSLSPDLQVIITDHAEIDEEWFQDAIGDNNWRGEKALIPEHWYQPLD